MPQPSLIPTRAGVGLPAPGNPLARGPPGHPYNNATDIPLWDHSPLTSSDDRLRGQLWCNALPPGCLQRLRRINSVPWRAGAPPPAAALPPPLSHCLLHPLSLLSLPHHAPLTKPLPTTPTSHPTAEGTPCSQPDPLLACWQA